MKHFLLGVASTLAVLALALLALVLTLGSGGGEAVAVPSPTASGTGTTPEQPDDLADDETWLGSVELRSEDVVSADAELVGVVATGSGVRFSPQGLSADRLDLDATVPYETVAAQVGEDVRIFDAGGGLAGIERQVTLLGRDVTLSATGTVTADGGQLLIEPETVDLGGPSFLDAAASAVARTLVTIREDVPGVPQGMALTDVEVTDAGFAATLSGTEVTIGR